MTNLDYFIVIAASFLGALGAGCAGWFASQEDFSLRKFMGTIWRAIFAAMLFSLGFDKGSDVTMISIISAFLGGAGVDVIGKRTQSAIESRYSIETKLTDIEQQIRKIAEKRITDKGDPDGTDT